MSADDHIGIGKLGRAHGVRGEVRFFAYNPESELLESGLRVFLRGADGLEPLTVERIRFANKFAIVKFEEISDRGEAEALTNLELFVDRQDFPEPDDDEVYQEDLVGCEVRLLDTPDGPERVIGEVAGFFATGANDVMVVRLSDASQLYVPVVDHALAQLDPDDGILLQPLDQWAPEDTELP